MTDKKLKVLTELEKRFCELYVENKFSNETMTNKDIAIAAGYAKDSAHQRAYENTTYKLKPHVYMHIEQLIEDFRIRNEVTKEKHMARLNEIHQMAKDKGQLHTAMNAEVYRGKAAGLYIERILRANKTIEDLDEEELEERMKKIEDDFGVRREKDETE
jgi:phage terminase small subunit